MLVVSDTSPLNYLVLVSAIEVLPVLFSGVIVPHIVLTELTHPHSPAEVRTWAKTPPPWLQIRSPLNVDVIPGLHRGETEAIALVKEVHAEALLVDEREATQIAIERGIRVVRTITILARAIALDLLDSQQTIDRLRQTNFRGPIESIGSLAREFKDRRRF